jgi:chemotaxis protein CheD
MANMNSASRDNLGDTWSPFTGRNGDDRDLVVVDISGMRVSGNPRHVLVTYSLGSCLAVTVYDPEVRIGGMIHCMLPLAKTDSRKALQTPCMFVDTGVTRLLQKLFDRGVKRSRAQIKVIGAARILDRKDHFRIGQRNVTVLRRLLWKNDLFIGASDVGGDITRTVRLDIATGKVFVRSNGVIRELTETTES